MLLVWAIIERRSDVFVAKIRGFGRKLGLGLPGRGLEPRLRVKKGKKRKREGKRKENFELVAGVTNTCQPLQILSSLAILVA